MEEIRYLLKFGRKSHVEEFARGTLFCSNAVTFWGIEDKLKIKGQGDILEAGSRIYAQKMTVLENSTGRASVISGNISALVHIEPAKHMPVFCMFAVYDVDCKEDRNGELHIALPDKTKEVVRSHFPNADSVAIIKNPTEYLEDVENTIGHQVKCERVHYFNIDNGFKVDNGHITAMDMQYMKYLSQDVPPVIEARGKRYSFVADYAYRALFCKDVFFSDEQEYRIVLPEERICKGTKYSVRIRQKIEVISLDELLG